MTLTVKPETARELKRIIQTRPMPQNGNPSTFGQRQIIWVSITSQVIVDGSPNGQWNGTITIYDSNVNSWYDYDTVIVIGANGGSFDIGYRYPAFCHGTIYVAVDIVGGFCSQVITDTTCTDGTLSVSTGWTKLPPIWDTDASCEAGSEVSSSSGADDDKFLF